MFQKPPKLNSIVKKTNKGGNMRNIGSAMLFFGIGSIVLNFIDMQFVILAWIDMWGPTVGWVIKGALIIVGAILFFVSGKKEETQAA
jgi:hypothetical protein